MKTWKQFFFGSLAGGLLFLCNGCLVIGNRAPDQHRDKTLGEELVDLKKAKENGALSEAEYETQRMKLLDARRR